MSLLRQLRNTLSNPDDGIDLSQAQWRALSRQVPLMYIMLMCNTLTVSWTYLESAPHLLTVYIPAALVALCAYRSIRWWLSRHEEVGPSAARRGVLAMIWRGAFLAAGFVTWSLALFPYSDDHQQGQLASFMALTMLGCVLCIMHVRTAALVVGAFVLVPYVLFFTSAGQPSFIAVALNLVMVMLVVTSVVLGNHRDFAALVASRNAVAQRHLETQRLLEENHRLANIDALTGIPNRRSFNRELADALRLVEARGGSIAVARVDIDNFRSVNEIFGQLTGDQVLAEIARRLNRIKRESTFLARLDGDNFALIMQEPTDTASLERCGEAVLQVLRETFFMSLGAVRITASMGLAASRPGDTEEGLFDRADYATWVAKREARGQAMVFSGPHARDLSHIRRLEDLFHNADLDEELYILVQPQFDVAIGETTGFEVLARWRSPVLGEVSPAEFIPMAERTGQICKVTQAVLRKALEVSDTLPRGLRLSVNLSAHDIGSTTAIERIVALVGAHQKPCRLDFEITETAVMHDLKQANASLLALLGLGARIALDDFGTGHSSLTHVQKLPLHRIKIDRSFVMEVSSDAASRAIVKTMIDLCRNLGISCVFEGIETEEQLEALVSLGGRVMQGYLFGRPMPPSEIPAHLEREQSLRRLERRAAQG